MKLTCIWITVFLFVLRANVFAAEPIKITIVAFGGKVTMTASDGKAVKLVKGMSLSLGSTISTGPNSWIDLAQGGLSTIRVKAKTQSLVVSQSSFDAAAQKTGTLLELKNGAVFIRTNKEALTVSSKYQIQMPELIAGVTGSEGEMVSGPGGDTIFCLRGTFTGNNRLLFTGQIMTRPKGSRSSTTVKASPDVVKAAQACADTLPTPVGNVTTGKAIGGTAAGVVPSGNAIAPIATGGSSTTTTTTTETTTTTPTPFSSPAEQTASPSSP